MLFKLLFSLLPLFCILVKPLTAQTVRQNIQEIIDQSWETRNSYPDSCIAFANKAIAMMDKEKDYSLLAEAYNFKGLGYRTKLEYDSSMFCFNQALEWSRFTKDSLQQAYSLNNIGGIYRLTSSYFPAISHILQAREIFFSINDSTGMAYCDINLSVLFRYQGDLEKSSEYLRSVIEFRKHQPDIRSLATGYTLLAENLYQQKLYDSALFYYNLSRNIYYEESGMFEKAAINNGIAGVLHALGKTDSAYLLRREALSIARQINNHDQMIRSHIGLASLYHAQNEFSLALSEIDSALTMAENKNLESRLMEASKIKADILFDSGEYKKAYLAAENYHRLSDSIFSEEKSKQINSLSSLHTDRIKESRINQQKEQIERQQRKNKTIALMLILAIIAFAQMVLVFRSQRKSLKLAKEEKQVIEEQKQVLAQLNTTKDQFLTMIAHDLRSPFQALLGLSDILATQSDQLTREEISMYSKKLNKAAETSFNLQENLLTWAKSQLGRIEKKIETVLIRELFDEILGLFEDLTRQKHILIISEVEEGLKVQTDKNILATALRNLVNNAAKFTPENGMIQITARRLEKEWIILVKDSGIGMSPELLNQVLQGESRNADHPKNPESGSGLGLLITQNFIKMLGGRISAESTPGEGSTFSIHLPLNL